MTLNPDQMASIVTTAGGHEFCRARERVSRKVAVKTCVAKRKNPGTVRAGVPAGAVQAKTHATPGPLSDHRSQGLGCRGSSGGCGGSRQPNQGARSCPAIRGLRGPHRGGAGQRHGHQVVHWGAFRGAEPQVRVVGRALRWGAGARGRGSDRRGRAGREAGGRDFLTPFCRLHFPFTSDII